MIHLLQAAELAADSTKAVPNVEKVAQNLAEGNVHWNQVIGQLIDWSLDAGKHILIAAVVYIIGHYLIKLLNYLLAGLLERRKVEVSVQTFVKSFVSILLQVLLIVTVIGALGVNTTSFAALLASFGVAIGMALSGNLQNFAGGIVILFRARAYYIIRYAREAFAKMKKVGVKLQKSLRNACRNEKVAVPLHPQTRQGYPDSLRGISHARSAHTDKRSLKD